MANEQKADEQDRRRTYITVDTRRLPGYVPTEASRARVREADRRAGRQTIQRPKRSFPVRHERVIRKLRWATLGGAALTGLATLVGAVSPSVFAPLGWWAVPMAMGVQAAAEHAIGYYTRSSERDFPTHKARPRPRRYDAMTTQITATTAPQNEVSGLDGFRGIVDEVLDDDEDKEVIMAKANALVDRITESELADYALSLLADGFIRTYHATAPQDR